jgi:V/A-type H+-transporting ATPase subunit K
LPVALLVQAGRSRLPDWCAAGAGAIAERPETAGTIIILEAIPETLVILGFVVAAMILLMVK